MNGSNVEDEAENIIMELIKRHEGPYEQQSKTMSTERPLVEIPGATSVIKAGFKPVLGYLRNGPHTENLASPLSSSIQTRDGYPLRCPITVKYDPFQACPPIGMKIW